MITLHNLAYSRGIRILWLFEELGLPYDLVRYDRTAEFRAPPELAAVHPLGKSPVIVDGDLVLAESSAVLRYIYNKHGNGMLTPILGSDAAALHDEWLDFVESTAVAPILKLLMAKMQGKDEAAIVEAKAGAKAMLDYIAAGIGDGPWLMGSELTLADMQMSYLLAMARLAGALEDQPVVSAYLDRILAHPSFVRATNAGGPMLPEKMPTR